MSVTIDVLMMRIPGCRASGSDREECQRWEGRFLIIHSHLTFPPKVRNDVLGPSFTSTPFLSIDAVGSEIWTALHGYTKCDTHLRIPNQSSIKLLNVLVLGFVVGCFVSGHRPPHRCHFSWSLPLALGLGEHFMSTSVVTLTKGFPITRPASRARR